MAEDEKRMAKLEADVAVLQNRADTLEKRASSIEGRLWTGIWVVLAFVANQILGLLPWGPK